MATDTNSLEDDKVEIKEVAAGDDAFLNGDGDSTSTYNDTGATAASGTTHVRVSPATVDDFSITVIEDDDDASTGAIVARRDPSPASDGPSGAVQIELLDTSDGTEVADDTDVSDLVLTYTVTEG